MRCTRRRISTMLCLARLLVGERVPKLEVECTAKRGPEVSTMLSLCMATYHPTYRHNTLY